MSTILTLDRIANSVLSVGNKEHNQHWPPHIIDEHINMATNFIIDRCVELYPGNNSIVGIVKPFLKVENIPVINGNISFPENYRNILGAAITVAKDKKSLCTGGSEFKNDPRVKTVTQLEKEKLRGTCISNNVNMVDQDEWSERTRSKYKFPTYEKPIGCIFEGEAIKICPYDIANVELRYILEPKIYRYGYQQLPDDTFVYDPNASVESEWEQTAASYLFKAVGALYSIYLRDPDMTNWNMQLRKSGIL